jgi:glutamate N-acetyltransferase / amino-acid N-acetyltransferase
MSTPKGFQFSAVEAAIKKPGRLDLGMICSETPATAAAVFTTNCVKAAPVLLGMEQIRIGRCRAMVVNSGNANACTGAQGLADARETAALAATELGISPDEIQVSSTGVIGVPLPMARIRSAVPRLVAGLGSGTLDQVATAIMTTDTFPKTASRTGSADGREYTVAGITKGAGMIMPNMATMLAYIITDAAVEPAWLTHVFREANDRSFNMISVDGDTSTNDTALIMANGAAGNRPLDSGHPAAGQFAALLNEVILSLAQQIVKDGEGATKFVAITVKGAVSVTDAKRAAMAVANSSLVKTAFFGQDANWGRILAAIGYSGARVDQDRLSLRFDDVLMAEGGIFAGGDAEEQGTEVLRKKEFTVTVNLGLGEGEATVYTSDLTYDYVKINGDYRT